MAERTKLLYIIVHEEKWNPWEVSDEVLTRSFRYTRTVLQSTLQLFGCKQRHSFKISKRVFSMLKNDHVTIPSGRHQACDRHIDAGTGCISGSHIEERQVVPGSTAVVNGVCKEGLFGNKYSSTVILAREKFLDLLCDALSEYRYMGPNQRNDLLLACRVRERKTSITILLCGTSGCGKSTLSSLLAGRLGITTVVSTDSIRHMMRSFVDEKENPLLWASTYHAGEFLDPVAVAEAKSKKQTLIMEEVSKSGHGLKEKDIILNEANSEEPGIIVKPKTMAVQGYKAQSEMVIDSLDRLITAWEQKCESVIVEGVHLSLNFVMGLMKKHPSIVPFMVYIANEEKHLERFAVRAKYMTLDPAKNKYVKYIRNIRTIQDYLCKRADKYLVPKVNNTNVDRSIAAMHATIFGCLRRRERGEPLYDQGTNTVKVIDEEYKNQWVGNSLGSKGMLQLIKRRGSSRQLVALVNTDGSVAKAWSFEPGDSGKLSSTSGNIHSGSILNIENPTVGGSAVEKSEPLNIQFGNFSLTAWEPDLGGPSHNGSIDGLSMKGGLSDSGSPHCSSSCSSTPRQGEGAEKELISESAASGSDEEPEEIPDVETDDDLDFENKPFEEHELEGSVDDESIRSEEEDDEFVAVDEHDNVYCSINTGGAKIGMEERIRIMHQDEVHVQENMNNCNGKVEHGFSVTALHEKENYFKGQWSMDLVQLMKR